jgi:hypothetical protein
VTGRTEHDHTVRDDRYYFRVWMITTATAAIIFLVPFVLFCTVTNLESPALRLILEWGIPCALNVRIDPEILRDLSGVLTPLLVMFAIFRGVDLAHEGGLPYLFRWRAETGYFWLEMLLFVFLPVVLLNLNYVRNRPVALYWTSVIVVMGFITNRINVSITGLERATHAGYSPKVARVGGHSNVDHLRRSGIPVCRSLLGHSASHRFDQAAQVAGECRCGCQRLILRRARESAPEPHPQQAKSRLAGGPRIPG